DGDVYMWRMGDCVHLLCRSVLVVGVVDSQGSSGAEKLTPICTYNVICLQLLHAHTHARTHTHTQTRMPLSIFAFPHTLLHTHPPKNTHSHTPIHTHPPPPSSPPMHKTCVARQTHSVFYICVL